MQNQKGRKNRPEGRSVQLLYTGCGHHSWFLPPLRRDLPPLRLRISAAAIWASLLLGRSMPHSSSTSVACAHLHVPSGEFQSSPDRMRSSVGLMAMYPSFDSLSMRSSPSDSL